MNGKKLKIQIQQRMDGKGNLYFYKFFMKNEWCHWVTERQH